MVQARWRSVPWTRVLIDALLLLALLLLSSRLVGPK